MLALSAPAAKPTQPTAAGGGADWLPASVRVAKNVIWFLHNGDETVTNHKQLSR